MNGKLAKNATLDPVLFFFVLQPKNHHLYSCSGIDGSTLAQYIFHVYLFVKPKRELEFKIIVSVALQDISSMYITLEISYVFILYVYYMSCNPTETIILNSNSLLGLQTNKHEIHTVPA